MEISVIVPFHNGEAYMERCVQALLAQRFPPDSFEVIMVDNNSSDQSSAIVERYPRVRLLRESTPGSYAARNRGVRDATGKILAFTDSDCAPSADWLQTIQKVMSSPGIHLVQGRIRLGTESLPLSVLADYEATKAAYTFTSGKKAIYYGYTNNMAVRRDAFDALGPFLEWMRGADVLLVHRVLDEYGTTAVTYSRDMLVTHLEITNIRTWLGKMRIYGRSFKRYGDRMNRRPLGWADRRQILRATIRNNGHSAGKSLLLVWLLSIGLVSYEIGRLTPSLRRVSV